LISFVFLACRPETNALPPIFLRVLRGLRGEKLFLVMKRSTRLDARGDGKAFAMSSIPFAFPRVVPAGTVR
jgi:hypothetical protein